jgi:hypothetical protein
VTCWPRSAVLLCSSYPRMRGIQYAAASRSNHKRLWNTGSPAGALSSGARSRDPLAGDDGLSTRALVLTARFSPESCQFVAPSSNRGRRESQAPTAPAAPCAKVLQKMHTGLTGTAETSRLSPRNGFTAYFVLSPVSGLSCHRRCVGLTSSSLTPGSRRQDHTTSPYAAAFSSGAETPDAASVHRNPRQRSVTTAKRPLMVTRAECHILPIYGIVKS